MALVNFNFTSYVLGMDSTVTVLLPEQRLTKPVSQPDKKYPVLYLLHGGTDDHTSYMRKSTIELLVREHGLIVVMPNGHMGFYTNTRYGYDYFDYLTWELPLVISNFFPASDKREDRFICGLSMGGYGTLKAALSRPDLYAAAACMSAAIQPLETLRLNNSLPLRPGHAQKLTSVFGADGTFENSENDLLHLLQTLDQRTDSPVRLYQCCGRQDFLYEQNKLFSAQVQSQPLLDVTYHEQDGLHNWDYWNQELPRIMEFFGFAQGSKMLL